MVNWRSNWSFRSHWRCLWKLFEWAIITQLLHLLLLLIFLLLVVFACLHRGQWVIFTGFTTFNLSFSTCTLTNLTRVNWSSSVRFISTHKVIHLMLALSKFSKAFVELFILLICYHRITSSWKTPHICQHDWEIFIAFNHGTHICIVLHEFSKIYLRYTWTWLTSVKDMMLFKAF